MSIDAYIFYRNWKIKLATTRGITDHDITFIKFAVKGFLESKVRAKRSTLHGKALRSSMRRSGFLKFLWALWCNSIPGIDVEDPRTIPNILTKLSKEQLYRHIINHFGECINFALFRGVSKLYFAKDRHTRKMISFPDELGKNLLIGIICNSLR